jgi:hypothetical protein
MSLLSLIDDSRTDKNTVHSYIDLYETLLGGRKETTKAVLEVGICKGGSIKLWNDYFPNATVYGVDVMAHKDVWAGLDLPRIRLCCPKDAYSKEFIKSLGDVRFDIVLDDGPHTLVSQIAFIKSYLPLLAEDGILIIEDVQSMAWIEELRKAVPEDKRHLINIYDLREKKGRYDDILFVVDTKIVN